jgi:C-terminal processing protease CtpA/Prc
VRDPDFSTYLYKAMGVARPLRQTQPDKNYWYQFLDNSQTGYIEYRVCGNDPKLSFQEFAQATLADLDKHNVSRVVIDLRENEGGHSKVIQPLIQGLKRRHQWKGHLFALIGPKTFSSAMMNAIELKMDAGAILVGEATGGKPDSYGEVDLLTLPNSKLVVGYTIKYFRAPKSMRMDAVYPDIPAALTIDDVLAGRDSGLAGATSAN